MRFSSKTPLIYTLLLMVGCATEPQMSFEGASTAKISVPYTIVAKGVVGEVCPGKGDFLASYETALQLALSKAPGANALANAQFQRREQYGKICVRVVGDAVTI